MAWFGWPQYRLLLVLLLGVSSVLPRACALHVKHAAPATASQPPLVGSFRSSVCTAYAHKPCGNGTSSHKASPTRGTCPLLSPVAPNDSPALLSAVLRTWLYEQRPPFVLDITAGCASPTDRADPVFPVETRYIRMDASGPSAAGGFCDAGAGLVPDLPTRGDTAADGFSRSFVAAVGGVVERTCDPASFVSALADYHLNLLLSYSPVVDPDDPVPQEKGRANRLTRPQWLKLLADLNLLVPWRETHIVLDGQVTLLYWFRPVRPEWKGGALPPQTARNRTILARNKTR